MSKVMLLVEIDEGDYGDFCDWFESVPSSVAGLPCIKGKFNTALYDAKPYNPTGYCISRNVLDEIRQLYKEYQPNLATEVIEFGDALEKLIDNAPTVEPEENIRTGYWETPEPDYARDGTRLPIRVAICSECQKPNKLPVGRYCSNCGSYNAGEE